MDNIDLKMGGEIMDEKRKKIKWEYYGRSNNMFIHT